MSGFLNKFLMLQIIFQSVFLLHKLQQNSMKLKHKYSIQQSSDTCPIKSLVSGKPNRNLNKGSIW